MLLRFNDNDSIFSHDIYNLVLASASKKTLIIKVRFNDNDSIFSRDIYNSVLASASKKTLIIKVH